MVSAHRYDMTAGCSAWSHPPRILLLLVLNKRARATVPNGLLRPVTMDRSLGGSSRRTLVYRTIARHCQASGPGTARAHPHVRRRDVRRRVNRVRRVISGRHRSGTLVSSQSTGSDDCSPVPTCIASDMFPTLLLEGIWISEERWVVEVMTVEMKCPLLILCS